MGDPLWHYKVLGLHCDGTNGSTTFTDVTGKTITANGDAKISTAQYPALTGKSSSGYLDGAGDYLSIPSASGDFTFGSGNFTIRKRIWLVVNNTLQILFDTRGTTNDYACAVVFFVSATGKLTFSAGTSNAGVSGTWDVNIVGSTTISTGGWHDVEASRSGSAWTIYLDGSSEGSATASITIGTPGANVFIGAGANGAGTLGYYLNGYISEVEVYKGLALHTADFTPVSTPFLDEYVSVSGTTKDSSGNFASRLVRVYRRDTGALVGSVLSNGTTGAYKVTAANSGTTTPLKHVVVCHDATADPPGSPTENALIYDGVTPI